MIQVVLLGVGFIRLKKRLLLCNSSKELILLVLFKLAEGLEFKLMASVGLLLYREDGLVRFLALFK